MPDNPAINHRRSIRLPGYDYSQAGLYFITICTQGHVCLFGSIENGKMILNDAGRMIEQQWQALKSRFDRIKLHESIVMPNHFHGIVEFVGVPLVGTQNSGQSSTVGQPLISGQPQGIAPTIGTIVGAFKSVSTNKYIRGVQNNNWPRFDKKIWQRNYYEHIIRDEQSYHQISEYIQSNPLKWMDDTYYA